MLHLLRKRRKHEKRPTAIECGLIAAVIAISGTTAVDTIGTELTTTFQGVGARHS